MHEPDDRWDIGFSIITWSVFTLFGVIWTISSIYMYSDFLFGSFNFGFIYVAIGVGTTILGIVRIIQIIIRTHGTKRFTSGTMNKEDWIRDETQDHNDG
ncbi:MAG TPA: hypothetical protein PK369_09255 [Thermoclostridium sp.]|nr:hypothetical protein [Clostridiaceae bacterium]HOQ76738.1 hypothetical protein [Thermoclostridium sp.]